MLSDFQNTLRDLLDGLWFERCAAMMMREKFAIANIYVPIKRVVVSEVRSDARRSLARAVFHVAVRRGG